MRMSSDLLDGLLRAPAPRPKQPTSRERAAMNRHRVLCAVAEHGHLRCVDLAAACWQGARFGEQMAQRTVRALVESGELKPRANALGGTSVVLTRPGAAALELRGIEAHHGLDLAVSGPTFRHGALTSRWCIHKQAEGFQAFTEYAIANGRAPLSREALFKRLGRHVDAVLIKGDKLYVCETESAAKERGGPHANRRHGRARRPPAAPRLAARARRRVHRLRRRAEPRRSASPRPLASAGSATTTPTRPRLPAASRWPA